MSDSEYQVITGRGEDLFERKIARALDDGWMPQGGVSIAYPTTCFDREGVRTATFAQAFTRRQNLQHEVKPFSRLRSICARIWAGRK